MDNVNYTPEDQSIQLQSLITKLPSKDLPPLFKNVREENVDELEKEITQNPDLVNKVKNNFGDAAIHIATKGKKLQALKTLLRNGAEVSLLSACGETALHLAVTRRWHEGIHELLQHGASPDKFSELKFNENELFSQSALHMAARRGDLQTTELLLGQSPNLSLRDGFQRTVLHMAAEACSIALLKRFLQEPPCQDIISQKDYKGNTVLHVAIRKAKVENEYNDQVENDILKFVELLIENGTDVNSSNLAGETPIYLATKKCLPKIVKFLLNSEADPSIVTESKNSVLHAACESDCNDCLNILLEADKVNKLITAQNDENKVPFHLAINSGSRQCCETLLDNGDLLGNKDCNSKNHCSLILENLPNALELLNRVFDKHVKIPQKSTNDPNLNVEFDFSVILKQKDDDLQCSLIPDITGSQFFKILKHPLIESFLVLKWNRLKFLFYTYVFIYFTFLMAHTYFIFCTFGPNGDWHKNWNDYLPLLTALRVIHIICYIIFLLPGTAMVVYNTHFLKDRETYYILMAILCSAFVVFSPNLVDKNSNLVDENRTLFMIERPIAAVAAAVSWGEFTLLLGKFPKFGKYISMLSTITSNMIKVFVGYSSLLVGHAIAFGILYRDQNVFASFIHSIVKILMMMIGEYNYIEMPTSEEKAKESQDMVMYLGSILLILFLFLVTILMTNLFIGVAVYDVKELLQHGKILRLYKEAQYIISYERFLEYLNKHHRGQISKLFAKIGQIPPKKVVYPNKHGLNYKMKFNIPKGVITEAINRKMAEMGKEDFFQDNGETDTAAIMKSFSKFYMTNLQKQRKPRELKTKQHRLLLDRLDNLEKLIQSYLSKPI